MSQPEEYDDIPELTAEMMARADFHIGDKLIRRGRGRPRVASPKKQVTLRLDADVIERFRASGPGWQVRVNDILRGALETTTSPAGAKDRQR
ncbi:BrnA antitoxin family protein [Methylobacterium sp.]|uniref:BrnA antitoxin family protein n=1 Tax=Methylobacterium sp. TaxID=409 RepID=UPI0025F5D132|nr:BrnA antitoxin family protein [Methylobacterium sp.]